MNLPTKSLSVSELNELCSDLLKELGYEEHQPEWPKAQNIAFMAMSKCLEQVDLDSEHESNFLFTVKYVDRPIDPYYYTRWDLAKTTTVKANTQADAFQKLWEMLGPAPSSRRWTAKIVKSEAL